MAGNYVLMMFYTTVAGWLLLYVFKMAKGDFVGLDADGVAGEFGSVLANPGLMTVFMLLCVVFCFSICAMGLQNGVEKINKDDDGLPVIPDGCAGNQFGADGRRTSGT